MSASASVLSGKAAAQGPVSSPLGRLCWYTVPDRIRVARDELEKKFIAAGVDLQYMPERIKPVDAFRRATSAAEKLGLPGPEKGTVLNILVREVLSDAHRVVRHLVREVVDQRNVRLTYEPAVELVFERAHSCIYSRAISGGCQEASDAASRASSLYDEYLRYYEGDHIRRMVKAILSSMRPTSVRPSGGVYFVPEAHSAELSALEALARSLSCEFFSFPLVDSDSARAMVEEKFSAQVAETVKSLTEAISSGGLTSGAVTSLLDRAKALLSDIAEYEALLERELGRLRADVEVVKAQMLALLDAAA